MLRLRIVHEDIDISPFLWQGRDECLHGSGVGDIESHGQDLDGVTHVVGNGGSELLQFVDAAGCEDQAEVGGTGASVFQGGAIANTRRSASDEDGLAGESLAGRGGHGGAEWVTLNGECVQSGILEGVGEAEEGRCVDSKRHIFWLNDSGKTCG